MIEGGVSYAGEGTNTTGYPDFFVCDASCSVLFGFYQRKRRPSIWSSGDPIGSNQVRVGEEIGEPDAAAHMHRSAEIVTRSRPHLLSLCNFATIGMGLLRRTVDYGRGIWCMLPLR